MYTLSLTIGLGANEIPAPDNFVRENIGGLLSTAMANAEDMKVNKFDVIRDFLVRSSSDIVLGYGAVDRSEYSELKKVLPVGRYRITTAYIKKSDKYSEYAKLYADHSNWLDYHPDFVKAQDEKYNQELDEFIKILKAENIEVIQMGVRL